MKTTFTMLQADAYAEAHSRSWSFLFAMRRALDLELGETLDFSDGLDLINGYGYTESGEVLPSGLILDGATSKPFPDIAGFDSLHGTASFTALSSDEKFDLDDVRACLEILRDRFWMLTYASGCDTVERDLRVAYRYRKSMLNRLDNFNW